MGEIISAVLVIGVIGLILGLALVTASKKFYVEVDERIVKVRDCLRGSNCGACGYAGCDAMAEAMVKGEAHVDGCPGNSTVNIAKIAAVLGKDSVSQDPQVAFVRCSGTCDATSTKADYTGLADCRAVILSGLSFNSCDYGCLGLGSCAYACHEGAITVQNGVAKVDPGKCVGCGLCTKACPKNIIGMKERVPHANAYCSNRDRGPAVKKICAVGCIGCGLCAKTCEHGAIVMENNLPVVDHSKCVACGKCVDKCPTKAMRMY